MKKGNAIKVIIPFAFIMLILLSCKDSTQQEFRPMESFEDNCLYENGSFIEIVDSCSDYPYCFAETSCDLDSAIVSWFSLFFEKGKINRQNYFGKITKNSLIQTNLKSLVFSKNDKYHLYNIRFLIPNLNEFDIYSYDGEIVFSFYFEGDFIDVRYDINNCSCCIVGKYPHGYKSVLNFVNQSLSSLQRQLSDIE